MNCLPSSVAVSVLLILFLQCHEKSVAMGIPMLNAIFESNPNVGLYTLPLLIWHPMQLVIGSFLAPRIANWVEREENRLEAEKHSVLNPNTTEASGDIEGAHEGGTNTDTTS